MGAIEFPLFRFKIPLIVKSPAEITPPVPVILILFTAEANTDGGSVNADVLVNNKSPETADILPFVLVIVLPLSVNVCAPIVSVPAVRFNAPPTITFPDINIPFDRFIVKLFSVIAARLVLAPLPPNVILADDPPVNVPELYEIVPFNDKVLAPIL